MADRGKKTDGTATEWLPEDAEMLQDIRDYDAVKAAKPTFVLPDFMAASQKAVARYLLLNRHPCADRPWPRIRNHRFPNLCIPLVKW